MAFDIFTGEQSRRDWAIGAAEPEVSKAEVWSPKQVKALDEVVNREVGHNVALAKKRLSAGTLDRREAEEFGRFAAAWKKWHAQRKLTSGKVADDLKKWRTDNAEWTKTLSQSGRGGVVLVRAVSLTVVEKKPALWRLIGGGAALLGLGWLIGKKG